MSEVVASIGGARHFEDPVCGRFLGELQSRGRRRSCGDDTTMSWRDATVETAPVVGALRIGTINLVCVAKCIGVGLLAVPTS